MRRTDAILAFSVYTLAVTIPWMADPWRQRVTTYIWSGVLFVMANALILVFKAKSPGYPFSLGLF
jgi:oligosaccharyltransferase complex subunit gamma